MKDIDGVKVDQQAEYSPSDQISLDYRPECRGESVKICVLKNVQFNIPDVYYHEDGCFSSNAKGTTGAEGSKYLQNSFFWLKHLLNLDQDKYLADRHHVRLCLSNEIHDGQCSAYQIDTNPFWSSTIPSTVETSCDGLYKGM